MSEDKTMGIDRNNEAVLNNSELISFYNGQNYVIEESIGYLIKHAQIALHRTIDSKMAALDLTALQWAPLMLLAYGKGRTAAELSRCSGVETSTMTRMIDRLETKELINRQRSDTDRRVIFLELTEAGKQLVSKVPFILAEGFNYHLNGFNQAELDTLKSMLRRLTENVRD